MIAFPVVYVGNAFVRTTVKLIAKSPGQRWQGNPMPIRQRYQNYLLPLCMED
jgi:hypothetical protein